MVLIEALAGCVDVSNLNRNPFSIFDFLGLFVTSRRALRGHAPRNPRARGHFTALLGRSPQRSRCAARPPPQRAQGATRSGDPLRDSAAASASRTMLSPKIIALEEGWNNEIKAKAIDVLARA